MEFSERILWYINCRWPAGAWCENLSSEERSSIQTSWWEMRSYSPRGILTGTHGSETRAGRPVRGGAWGRGGGPPTRTWAVWYPFDTSKAAAFHFLYIRASVSHVHRDRNATRHRIVMRTIYPRIFSFMRFGPQQKMACGVDSHQLLLRPKIDRGVARAIAFPEDPFCESTPKIIPRWHIVIEGCWEGN